MLQLTTPADMHSERSQKLPSCFCCCYGALWTAASDACSRSSLSQLSDTSLTYLVACVRIVDRQTRVRIVSHTGCRRHFRIMPYRPDDANMRRTAKWALIVVVIGLQRIDASHTRQYSPATLTCCLTRRL